MKIDNLKSLYAEFDGADLIERNRCIFEHAVSCGLAVAGSIAMAVACKKAKKIETRLREVHPSLAGQDKPTYRKE